MAIKTEAPKSRPLNLGNPVHPNVQMRYLCALQSPMPLVKGPHQDPELLSLHRDIARHASSFEGGGLSHKIRGSMHISWPDFSCGPWRRLQRVSFNRYQGTQMCTCSCVSTISLELSEAQLLSYAKCRRESVGARLDELEQSINSVCIKGQRPAPDGTLLQESRT